MIKENYFFEDVKELINKTNNINKKFKNTNVILNDDNITDIYFIYKGIYKISKFINLDLKYKSKSKYWIDNLETSKNTFNIMKNPELKKDIELLLSDNNINFYNKFIEYICTKSSNYTFLEDNYNSFKYERYKKFKIYSKNTYTDDKCDEDVDSCKPLDSYNTCDDISCCEVYNNSYIYSDYGCASQENDGYVKSKDYHLEYVKTRLHNICKYKNFNKFDKEISLDKNLYSIQNLSFSMNFNDINLSDFTIREYERIFELLYYSILIPSFIYNVILDNMMRNQSYHNYHYSDLLFIKEILEEINYFSNIIIDGLLNFIKNQKYDELIDRLLNDKNITKVYEVTAAYKNTKFYDLFKSDIEYEFNKFDDLVSEYLSVDDLINIINLSKKILKKYSSLEKDYLIRISEKFH